MEPNEPEPLEPELIYSRTTWVQLNKNTFEYDLEKIDENYTGFIKQLTISKLKSNSSYLIPGKKKNMGNYILDINMNNINTDEIIDKFINIDNYLINNRKIIGATRLYIFIRR